MNHQRVRLSFVKGGYQQGRMIDIEKLRSANEDTRAIGNMNVNAKGDVLGIKGSIATPKAEVIKKLSIEDQSKSSILNAGFNFLNSNLKRYYE